MAVTLTSETMASHLPGWAAAPTGAKWLVICPPNLAIASCAGSDFYTTFSHVYTAAIHAGFIVRAEGGKVKVVKTGYHGYFSGTTRNGITSNDSGTDGVSFVFEKPKHVTAPSGTLVKDSTDKPIVG